MQALDKPWWTLRLTYGVVPIVAGLDKFEPADRLDSLSL